MLSGWLLQRAEGRICARLGLDSVRAVQKRAAETGDLTPQLTQSMVKLFTITGDRSPYCSEYVLTPPRTVYRVGRPIPD